MNFNIERTFKCEFLIKKINFLDNRPCEVFIPEEIELSAKRYKIKTMKEIDENSFVE